MKSCRRETFSTALVMIGLFLGAVLGGCATPASSDQSANDPFEGLNRAVFNFNDGLDEYVAIPLAKFYNRTVPEPARNGIHNFLANLDTPVTLGNDIMQIAPRRAGETLVRVTLNTTIGIGGFIDVAKRIGIPEHKEDFGQTLGLYGVDEGPYLVIPLIGPAPPRDLVGKVADTFLDPLHYVDLREKTYWSIGRGTLNILDNRTRTLTETETIKRTSVDYYAAVRSLYLQNRAAEIRNGNVDLENLPEY